MDTYLVSVILIALVLIGDMFAYYLVSKRVDHLKKIMKCDRQNLQFRHKFVIGRIMVIEDKLGIPPVNVTIIDNDCEDEENNDDD